MGYKVRKFSIRNQTFGTGAKRRVGLVNSRRIMVNGVKQKPGERAKLGTSQLLSKATHRTK